jgi:hypothetical protein
LSFRGRVENGVVILQSSDGLPEGTLVEVTPLASLPRVSNSFELIAAMEGPPHLSLEDIDELNRAIAAGKRPAPPIDPFPGSMGQTDAPPLGNAGQIWKSKQPRFFAALPIEAVEASAADIYGRTRSTLEASGFNLSDNDLWIAASALSLGAVLVTNDQAFSHVPGLSVEDWTQ